MVEKLEDWLKTRPKCIQDLAAEFPIGSIFNMPDGSRMYLIGYNEDDSLIVSKIDPNVDYDNAIENEEYICADHFRVPDNLKDVTPRKEVLLLPKAEDAER